ncbi:CYFA0S07e04742g1_1 [Cyberlindnera fabianii]|uniref:Mediator of RNA polymerase II transcription subunit 18 n=1 Tax=Cyberlindnera fabianii TaxID=36022 RepID=A0A061AWS2_CYBFA|nr:CYFA0S07e04742g1_1 [Cyberlindnera fabianii]
MVQQLSLFGQITRSQHDITAVALGTLTGSAPSPYTTYTLLASPKRVVKYEPNSKNAQFEQYKLHLKSPYDDTKKDRSEYSEWVLQVSDVPSAGKRKISTQAIVESCILVQKDQSIDTVLDSIGYLVEKEYLVKGVRVFYGNIVIEMFQVLVKTAEGEWKELDDRAYLIKCFINVEKATDVENLQKSSQELMNLKNELTGFVELDIPDRNVMDSRIGIRK